MKQLTGLDGSFLYMETPTTFGHVNGLGHLRPTERDVRPLRRGVRPVRLQGRRARADAPAHRRGAVRTSTTRTGSTTRTSTSTSTSATSASPRRDGWTSSPSRSPASSAGRWTASRPLWEVYVIEGLESGRWALLTKYHHATIDGASGVLMLNLLNDLTPGRRAARREPAVGARADPERHRAAAPDGRQPAAQPGQGGAGADAHGPRARRVGRDHERRHGGPPGRRGDQGADRVRATTGRACRCRLTAAPPTPWNKSVTAHRRFAMRSASLSNLKRLKDATGGTLNDVVMAVCAGALRAYLELHDALPDRPLRAMVPVSIRTGDEAEPWTNRVSALTVDLPTNEPDPLQRVARCREAMDAAKQQFELVPAAALVDIQQYSSPVVATSAIRLAARLRLADRMAPPVNVIISNVPGPRQPLYIDGAQLQQYIPVSTIGEGMGLNITVHSYLDELVFGLVSCRELVPGPVEDGRPAHRRDRRRCSRPPAPSGPSRRGRRRRATGWARCTPPASRRPRRRRRRRRPTDPRRRRSRPPPTRRPPTSTSRRRPPSAAPPASGHPPADPPAARSVRSNRPEWAEIEGQNGNSVDADVHRDRRGDGHRRRAGRQPLADRLLDRARRRRDRARRSPSTAAASRSSPSTATWWDAELTDETWRRTSLGDLAPAIASTSSVPSGSPTVSAATSCRATSTASARSSSRRPTCGCAARRSCCATSSRRGRSRSTGSASPSSTPLDDGFTVAVIPHTADVTTLGDGRAGRTRQPGGRRDGQVRRAPARLEGFVT